MIKLEKAIHASGVWIIFHKKNPSENLVQSGVLDWRDVVLTLTFWPPNKFQKFNHNHFTLKMLI